MLAHSFSTEIGTLTAIEDHGCIVRIVLPNGDVPDVPKGTSGLLIETEKQIGEYLSGKRKEFTVPVSYDCGEFGNDVMKAMSSVPYGKTVSYGHLAHLSGHPNAHRAAGTVCRKNPIPIIVPCHRILPSSGKTGNYAGGPEIKEFLLKLERDRSE